jgi:hypothetical protein
MPAIPAARADTKSPGSGKLRLASRGIQLGQNRPWPGLVDLSRIPSGTVFREVHPASEMGYKLRQNRLFSDVGDITDYTTDYTTVLALHLIHLVEN